MTFQTKVRDFIRVYVPKENLKELQAVIEDVDSYLERLDGFTSDPTEKGLDEIYDVAYSYAVSQLSEYRLEQNLLQLIADGHLKVIHEHQERLDAIPNYPLRNVSESGIETPLYETEKRRQELIAKSNESSKAKKAILKEDITPLRVVYHRTLGLIKALSNRAMTQFPAKEVKPGWFPDKPISDSTRTTPNPLEHSNASFDCCRRFADMKHLTLSRLLQLSEKDREALTKSEKTKEREALQNQRTRNLRNIRQQQRQELMRQADGLEG